MMALVTIVSALFTVGTTDNLNLVQLGSGAHTVLTGSAATQQTIFGQSVTAPTVDRNTQVTSSGSRKFIIKSGDNGFYLRTQKIVLENQNRAFHKFGTSALIGRGWLGNRRLDSKALQHDGVKVGKITIIGGSAVAPSGTITGVTSTGSRKFIIVEGKGNYFRGSSFLISGTPVAATLGAFRIDGLSSSNFFAKKIAKGAFEADGLSAINFDGVLAAHGVLLTQEALEVALHQNPPIQFTQEVLEFGVKISPPVRFTQEALELVYYPLTRTVFTQLALEVAFHGVFAPNFRIDGSSGFTFNGDFPSFEIDGTSSFVFRTGEVEKRKANVMFIYVR